MLEVIRDCRSDEARVDDCLGKIDISAKHLLSLVNDVLDMSKIESNSFVVEAKPFNLGRTLAESMTSSAFRRSRAGCGCTRTTTMCTTPTCWAVRST